MRDTDAALLEISTAKVEETRAIGENVYADHAKSGNLVSITIEHAAQVASLTHVRIEEIDVSVG